LCALGIFLITTTFVGLALTVVTHDVNTKEENNKKISEKTVLITINFNDLVIRLL